MNEDILNLFILEDNKEQGKIYHDAIADYCKKKSIKIIVDLSVDLDEGRRKLKTSDYDAAILDLKLGGDDTEGKGNEIIREIKQKLRFPIFIVSGFVEELDSDLREQNVFYKVYKRTEKNTDELIEEIVTIYNTGITKILGRKGKIESTLQDIFWKHIARNMNYWKSETKNPQECEKILLRYILAYLAGYLEMDEAGEFLCYNPVEFYIIPPIRSYIFTGDILKKKNDGKLFIVLTPACDLAQGKAKDVTLVTIEEKEMEFVAQQKRILSESLPASATEVDRQSQQKKKDDADRALRGLLTNNLSFKYHFLPLTEQFPGGFVNFQKVITLKLTQINTDYERMASVTDKFIKDIIARFSHYYARQGQPDFDIDELFKKQVNIC